MQTSVAEGQAFILDAEFHAVVNTQVSMDAYVVAMEDTHGILHKRVVQCGVIACCNKIGRQGHSLSISRSLLYISTV